MALKDTIYWKIFSDVWSLLKRFFPVQDSDKYWNAVVTAADDVYKKYQHTAQQELAKELVLVVLNELERIYKGKREKSNEIENY